MIPLPTLSLLLLLMHLIADYYLQWTGLSQRKQESWPSLLLHGLIYAAVFALPLLIDLQLWPLLAALAAGHLLVDLIKRALSQRLGQRGASGLYYADQALHLLSILLGSHLWSQHNNSLPGLDAVDRGLLKWAILLLLILKPATISLKLSLRRFAEGLVPATGDGQAVVGAGALIGHLERLLTAMLLGLQQYAAIGLMFTAKSVARFDRISKDQRFAEYYLIGSLMSLLWVFAGWLILFQLIS